MVNENPAIDLLLNKISRKGEAREEDKVGDIDKILCHSKCNSVFF